MYQFEEITNDEGIAFSKEIDSIYRRTSAKSGEGIDELFRLVGQKFLNPNSINTTNMTNEELKKHGDKLKREKIKKERNQKAKKKKKLIIKKKIKVKKENQKKK